MKENKSKKELKQEKKIKKLEEKKEKLKEKRENKKNKKIKIKKSVILPLIIVLIVIIILIITLSIFVQKNTIFNIKKNYNQFVITTKDTKIYNKNKKVIGTIKSKTYLELDKVKITSTKNKYLKIKDTDIYIKYNDIKKTKEIKKEPEDVLIDKNYYPLSKEISIKQEVTLYNGKEKFGTIKELDIQLEYMNDKNYYINFLGNTLSIKKNKNIKEKDIKEDKNSKKAKQISVIYYDKIDDSCTSDECLKYASVLAHMEKILNNGYYFITKQEYIDYLKGYKDLKENAVLLSTSTENEITKSIKENLKIEIAVFTDKDNITFETTNKPSSREDDLSKVNRYQAKRYTLIDDYIDMAAGLEVADVGWQTNNNQGVAVINYHFFTNEEKGVVCTPYESICLPENYFRDHLDYLKENNYKTLTMKEFADWMDGIIEIPQKSVLLTIDDGAKGTGKHNGDILIPVLEEYKMHATLFLITGWWDLSNYQSEYLDVQSHTNDMHNTGTCGDVQLVCANYNQVKEDLQKTIDILGDKTSFCYPFYKYDNEAIQAIKDLGFRVAFAGGSRKAKRSDNHYIIPRYPVIGNLSKQGFANMVN